MFAIVPEFAADVLFNEGRHLFSPSCSPCVMAMDPRCRM
jgi:hypothetical protein